MGSKASIWADSLALHRLQGQFVVRKQQAADIGADNLDSDLHVKWKCYSGQTHLRISACGRPAGTCDARKLMVTGGKAVERSSCCLCVREI